MKTPIATAALTVLFLSAGAFAGTNHQRYVTAAVEPVNVTVITKNQSWPVKGEIGFGICPTSRCLDIRT